MREVWSGDKISACAARPPKPPRLGNPAVFVKIQKQVAQPLWFSKRDARAYFDLLKLPAHLRRYFGRPYVIAKDLAKHLNIAVQDLCEFLDDASDTCLDSASRLTPVAASWPMGFSWSSFVAQSQMVAVCTKSGLRLEQLLCLDKPFPQEQSELATVATDDVLFVHADRSAAKDRLAKFDEALVGFGIEKNNSKDVDMASSMVGLGCCLGNSPPCVEPDESKLLTLLLAIVGLSAQPSLAPAELASILGVAQWFAQLSRWHFSIFSKVYAFQRLEPQEEERIVDQACVAELLLFAALAPLLSANLERPFASVLAMCDASPSFGFGVSVHSCSASLASTLATKSERLGDHLRMTLDADADEEKPRAGQVVRLACHSHKVRSQTLYHSRLSISATLEPWRLKAYFFACSGCFVAANALHTGLLSA